MIKMSADTKDNRKLVMLGLSFINITKLLEGQPIRVRGNDVNVPGIDIVLFAGEDEDTMKTELASLIGPDTIVTDHRKPNDQAPKQK